MLDGFNRNIDYLRISVTDKCNLRCVYCMPEDGVTIKEHSDLLSFEQIEQIVIEAVKLGISKLRVTGGEPLVRKDVDILIKKLATIEGIQHIGLTTNGILLKNYADILEKNGLNSINISLDTLDPERYKKLTRRGNINDVFEGIEAVKSKTFKLKLNMIVFNDTTRKEIEDMKKFCKNNKIRLQLIKHFSLKKVKIYDINYDRPKNCNLCNSIRLTYDGMLKPCLHSNTEIKMNFDDIRTSLVRAIKSKPEKGLTCNNRDMYQIGG